MEVHRELMELHPSISEERIEEEARRSLFEEDQRGVCVACGEDAYEVEPDAEKRRCEYCGARGVYGWEQILLRTVA
jgi:DNA-directed RNA polymerase subunit RPC12/RpoP